MAMAPARGGQRERLNLAALPLTLRAAHALRYIGKPRIPSGDRGEGLGIYPPAVPASAGQQDRVLAALVTELFDLERPHPPILRERFERRPSSTGGSGLLGSPDSFWNSIGDHRQISRGESLELGGPLNLCASAVIQMQVDG